MATPISGLNQLSYAQVTLNERDINFVLYKIYEQFVGVAQRHGAVERKDVFPVETGWFDGVTAFSGEKYRAENTFFCTNTGLSAFALTGLILLAQPL